MLKKRLIGVITVKNGLAVQSFGYDNYLPLGKPEILAKNFDRWGADEIILNVIDRSINDMGPDYNLLKKLSKYNLSTPIIYGGGISTKLDAVRVIKEGADRIILENIFHTNDKEVKNIYSSVGSQAIIMSMPVCLKKNILKQYVYTDKKIINISSIFLKYIKEKIISEIMLIDYINEGSKNNFNINLIKKLKIKDISLIVFGGIGEKSIINKLLQLDNVAAIAVGNSLNYSENKIQDLKQTSNKHFRKIKYDNES
jgi:cyclase